MLDKYCNGVDVKVRKEYDPEKSYQKLVGSHYDKDFSEGIKTCLDLYLQSIYSGDVQKNPEDLWVLVVIDNEKET